MTTLRRKQPAQAETPAEQQPETVETMVLRIALVFTVDGKPVANAPFVAELPRPAEDQAAQLQIALDARVLAQWLEPHLGPSAAAKPKLWTPGA